MTEKPYDWIDGAQLEPHSLVKHKILKTYFYQYITVRCRRPQQSRFKLAVVDGFAGGGRYRCGAPGSPIVFLGELKRASEALNIWRAAQGLRTLEIDCTFFFNDLSPDAIETLKSHVAEFVVGAHQGDRQPKLSFEYSCAKFEQAYPGIKSTLQSRGIKNVIFNLDQYGTSRVHIDTIRDIMSTFASPEIFLTFMIGSLLAFLPKNGSQGVSARLSHLGISVDKARDLDLMINNQAWLGAVENIVFDAFKSCSQFVSPFSINNPNGWRYWMLHFSNVYRARQVYNNVLHDNANLQAHFGRSGLEMLSYDRRNEEGVLYLFDDMGRARALDQLLEDVPRFVADAGDSMTVLDFYNGAYNATPAHSDDLHRAIIMNPDLEVLTGDGGTRRRPNTIIATDTIRRKRQASFDLKVFGGPSVARR